MKSNYKFVLTFNMGNIIRFALWVYCIIYAFLYWGFWWGVLNIFIPFAPIWDLVKMLVNKIGKIE